MFLEDVIILVLDLSLNVLIIIVLLKLSFYKTSVIVLISVSIYKANGDNDFILIWF